MPEDRVFWGEFFQLYKEHPCLWKIKSTHYLNKYKKNEAYGKLAEKLKEKYPDATTDLVKKKINIYRSNFRKEAKKVEDSIGRDLARFIHVREVKEINLPETCRST